jgi:FAD/FMN-containing dehydrogenase
MTDFIEVSSHRLGGQFAGHVSVPGDKLTATRELHAMMQGRVVSRGDDDYPRTRRVWNGAVENQPALFAVCETSADVQAAVRSARQHGLSLSVRGGGHGWAGSALCQGSSLT